MSDNVLTNEVLDRAIITATQQGMPVSRRPYHDIANQLGLDPPLVMERLQEMLNRGVIRRIGVVPNHYALGYQANGMSVWDVPDEKVKYFGNIIGKLDFVSHCYHRPRHPPDWPYNLFAMDVPGKIRKKWFIRS
jgi:siroheme decarboxylase